MGRARSRQTAHEFVRETIRRSILSGELQGGTRLVQAELAEALDVSTTPVREALRDLASDGLIQLDAHRGGVVRELQPEELTEIYEIRKILEPEAMRLAVARITPEALARCEELHERMEQSENAVDFLLLNREFHLSIYDAIDSPRLMGILTGLLDASAMYVGAAISSRPDLRLQAVADHVDILDAIRSGDADAAAAAILDHLRIPQLFLEEE
jgi:DNA-binding GntR family transcriptional regulator